MGDITSSLGRPIQGVSQQPQGVRSEGQCETLENMIPSVSEGLKRRMGTALLAILDKNIAQGAKFHHYARGDGEEYLIIYNGELFIYDMQGRQATVTADSASLLYLSTHSPSLDLDMLTVSDYTFINNRHATVKINPETSKFNTSDALVYVQMANYGKTYSITIDGVVVAKHSTPIGDKAEQLLEVDTTYVATQLMGSGFYTKRTVARTVYFHKEDEDDSNDHDYYYVRIDKDSELLVLMEADNTYIEVLDSYTSGDYIFYEINYAGIAAGDSVTSITQEFHPDEGTLGDLSGYDVKQYGNLIHIRKTDKSSFTLTVEDGAAGGDLIAIKGAIDSLSKLPPNAPDGFRVKVQADPSDDGYWLISSDATDEGRTKWVETIDPDSYTGFDLSSMPHVLVRDGQAADGTILFTLRQGEWAERDVGGDITNPLPSFINLENPQPIQSMGMFQNRLYFTSAESVIMSRSDGSFFNFFKRTTLTSTATDPVDVFADASQINNISSSAILDGDLILFSENAQFLISGSQPITSENATLQATSSFESQTQVPPAVAGDNLFFAFDYGEYSGVREYFTDSISDTKRARPITSHVQEYLKGQVTSMSSSTNHNWLLVTTTSETNRIYLYNWAWEGNTKVQSAWHTWVFPEDTEVLFAKFSKSTLYLLMRRGEEAVVSLESLDLGDADHGSLPFPIRLDSQQYLAAKPHTIDGVDVWLTDPMPEADMLDEGWDFILAEGNPAYEGISVPFKSYDGFQYITDIELGSEGQTVVLLCIGRPYTSLYVPTPPVVKDYKERPISLDRIRIARYYINYEHTGYVKVTITTAQGVVKEHEYYGRTVGTSGNNVGTPEFTSGSFKVGVMQKANNITTSITSSSHYPLQINDIEYKGQYTQHGRRI